MPSIAESLALSIVQRLQSAGHVAYFAGGCVRDRVMGREPKDFDVATSAVPDQVIALFPRSQRVGVSFGVVLVRERRAGKLMQIEVATFRADSTYSDGRHPDSVRYTNAQEDAQRRDFTCNGLFFDPLAKTAAGEGQLHDFVGGMQDIQDKILRAIGDPYRRFAEDHLRMLRAIRFAGKLGFTIEAATWDAIRKLAPQIAGISRERIAGELRLILAHPSRAHAMKLLQESLLLEHFWPAEMFPEPQRPRQWVRLSRLPREATFAAALVAVHQDLLRLNSPGGGPAVSSAHAAHLLQERLALSNQEMEDFLWLDRHLGTTLHAVENNVELLRVSALKRLMADARWDDLLLLLRAGRNDSARDAIEESLFAKMREQGVAPAPFITGESLIRLGATPGPQFKRWLDDLYDRQLEGEFPTEQDAITAVRRLIMA